MPDKTANWGVPGDDARYRTRDDDPAGGGDYIVAETLDANGDPVEVLLRWDDTAGEWVSGGPVNLDGNDVTNVGALDAELVSTGEVNNAKQARTSSQIENLINNASAGDTIRIAPGTHTGVSDLVIPAPNVTVIAYGATIVADSAGISGSPSRWPDINGQDGIEVYGGEWDANPTDGDPPTDGVADYGFGNSGATVEGVRIQDVTVTGFASMSIRPRNWLRGQLINPHAYDTETGYCPVLCEDSTFEGLSAENVGDTFILFDRNTNCSVTGGTGKGNPTGTTHGFDCVGNTDCSITGLTYDGAGDATDGVNIRDAGGTPNTGLYVDVAVRNVVSFGAIARSGANHDVVIDGQYTSDGVGIDISAGTAEIRGTIYGTSGAGMRTPGGTAIVNGATFRNCDGNGCQISSGHIASVHSEGNTGADVRVGSGVSVESVSPPVSIDTTTNSSGAANIDLSGRIETQDKPQVAVTLEQAGQWYASGFVTDGSGYHTTVEVTLTDSSGTGLDSVPVAAKVDGV